MRPVLHIAIACLAFMSCLSTVAAAASDQHEREMSIDLMVGRSHVINSEQRISQVIIVDPTVADAEVIGARRLILYARKLGATDVILSYEDDTTARYELEVVLDTYSLQERIDNLFGPGVVVDLDGGVLVLSGMLDNVEEAVRLEEFMEAVGYKYVDMTRIPGVQQVLLKVRIAEVSREALRSLAFSAVVGGSSAFGGFQPGADGQPFNPVGIQPSPGGPISPSQYVYQDQSNVVSNAATLFGGIPSADLSLYINALTQNNYFRLLAEPNLVAVSGEEASFLVGGEFPIPVVQGTSVGVGSSVTVEYKEVGVRLSFTPQVLGSNRIRLDVAPEVSDLSESFAGVSFSGFSVPGVLVRRSSTTVELHSGQTFAMAGLLQSKTEAENASVPLLGDLPIIGPLFRSMRYRESKTDLVVLVTAELVEPMDTLAGGEVLPGMLHNRPNDWEFFINGKIEDSVVAPLPPNQAELMRKLGIDKLSGPGAWKRFDDMPVPARPDYIASRSDGAADPTPATDVIDAPAYPEQTTE